MRIIIAICIIGSVVIGLNYFYLEQLNQRLNKIQYIQNEPPRRATDIDYLINSWVILDKMTIDEFDKMTQMNLSGDFNCFIYSRNVASTGTAEYKNTISCNRDFTK